MSYAALLKTTLGRRGGITVGSKEIFEKRKLIEEEFQAHINLTTGQLNKAKEEFDLKMKKLQGECDHMWDTGEYAMQKVGDTNICPICRKKSKL